MPPRELTPRDVTLTLDLPGGVRGRTRWGAIGLVAIVAAVVYANSLQNGFVIDDVPLIPKNPAIRSFSNIPRLFVPPLEAEGSDTKGYRVIRTITYIIDYHLYGLKPFGYHATNVLLHVTTSALVLLITLRLLGRSLPALFTALLFAVHPIQTEAVAYVTGRKDVLCALFYLWGFYSFLSYRQQQRPRQFAGLLLAFLLALLSKEGGITLPISLLLFDTLMRVKSQDARKRSLPAPWRRGLVASLGQFPRLYAALFIVALAFGVYVVFWSGASAKKEFWGGGLGPTILTSARIYLHYIKLLLFPVTLTATYSYDAFPVSTTILDPSGLFSLAAVAAILYGLIRLARVSPEATFGGLWFFITLLPVSQLVPHHVLVAERHVYLPSFGFALAAGTLFSRLEDHARARRLLLPAAGALLVVLSVRTVVRNFDWRDAFTLWRKTVQSSPRSARAHVIYGAVLQTRRRPADAEREFRTALEIDPKDERAHASLGALLRTLGRLGEAEHELTTAVRLNPDYRIGHYELGRFYQLQGRWGEAEREQQAAVRLDPNFDDAHLNLGLVYLNQGRLAEAEQAVRKALEITPGLAEAHRALGQILVKSGRTDERLRHLQPARGSDSDTALAHNNLGVIYMQSGQVDRALEAFQSAVRMNPDLLEARANLARLYLRQGRGSQAEEVLKEGIRRRPNDARLHYQLGALYRTQGVNSRAAEALREAVRLDPGLADARRALDQLSAGGP